jgi:hypothetical protein
MPSVEKRLCEPGSAFGTDKRARASSKIENRQHRILSLGRLVVQGRVLERCVDPNKIKIRDRRVQHKHI